ncbi:hypothetical protein [Dongia sp.]|uniref:hypothetical protein n=1 Tax=Dongia sp. TaxID=1977262 RepID=UPI0035AF2D21
MGAHPNNEKELILKDMPSHRATPSLLPLAPYQHRPPVWGALGEEVATTYAVTVGEPSTDFTLFRELTKVFSQWI